MKWRSWAVGAAVAFALPVVASAAPWGYHDPGDLEPNSGQGRVDWMVYAPGMRYPMGNGPSFANSQVYRPGGSQGGGGTQCDAVNYDYPWRDNYCEIRSWDMPLCPAGTGHQGQDIRPATCEKSVHPNVATVDGTITNIGSYSVYLTDPQGRRYDYLHGDTNMVSVGQDVSRGDPINLVSNAFGGTSTTIHLHFNLKQDVAGYGFVYVPPYMSLIQAYEDLMDLGNAPPDGTAAVDACEAITGWAQDPDTPDDPVTVEIWFDGTPDEPTATGVMVLANQYRMDLCDSLGSCEHGFEIDVPLSLRDGYPHVVHAYGTDTEGGGRSELPDSPTFVDCDRPPVPEGVRRPLAGPDHLAAWGFSPFWSSMRLSAEELDGIETGPAVPDTPVVVVDEANVGWLIDGSYRRRIPSQAVADAWGFDLAAAPVWTADELDAYAEGTDLRPEPILVRGPGPVYYLVDDPQCDPNDPACGAPGGSSGGPSSDDGGGGDGTGGGTAGGSAATAGLPEDYGGDDGGCGCRSDARPRQPSAIWALTLLALGRRRRR